MKNIVYKFGGAALKSAEAIKNIGEIVKSEPSKIVVVSALDKTTNALEKLVEAHFSNNDLSPHFSSIKNFHTNIITDLFGEQNNEAAESLTKILHYCETYLQHNKNTPYDEVYDQIIPAGELLSSKILAAYLKKNSLKVEWLDARKILKTDSRHRKAKPNFSESEKLLNEKLQEDKINLIQGFIGGTDGNLMTTIGREGSDYSAALFANFSNAKKLVVWKDVDGVLNADPRYFDTPELIESLNYKEAIELSYYGATIIHPKTIQPLAEKDIPLQVRSFQNLECNGSIIDSKSNFNADKLIYIYKPNQLLLTVSSKDLSFIGEQQMSQIYHALFEHKLEVNLVQNSAVNCTICVDTDTRKTDSLIEELNKNFSVKYNTNLELLTIRHYKEKLLKEILKNKELIIEQKTRNTLKLLFK